jgi:addiction module RelE/StbE family toxin
MAAEDREQILQYIAADNPSAAIEVGDEIERQAEMLLDFPEIGRPGRIDGTRELVIQGLPYIACYAVTDDAVTILRVLHGRRKWPESI